METKLVALDTTAIWKTDKCKQGCGGSGGHTFLWQFRWQGVSHSSKGETPWKCMAVPHKVTVALGLSCLNFLFGVCYFTRLKINPNT